MRRNCLTCTRWLHAVEFPYFTAGTCSRCALKRAWDDHFEYQRKLHRLAYERRELAKAAAKVRAGEAVWSDPIRVWLLEDVWLPERPGGGQGRYVARWEFYGLDQLATWARADEKTLRQLRDGKRRTIGVGIVDGILLHAPAAPAFNTLYPPDELDPVLVAA